MIGYMSMGSDGHFLNACAFVSQVFWDLANDSLEDCPSYNTLRIHENELLGKGGFGFVCKAELVPENPGGQVRERERGRRETEREGE